MSSNLQRLVIADFTTGLETDKKPFLLDNDAFPVLVNALLFRRRIEKKFGTLLIGRLQRDLTAQSLGNTDGGGALTGNIFTILLLSATQPNASVITTGFSITVGAQIFTDPLIDGNLTNGAGGLGTINYATGDFTLQTAPVLAATPVSVTFSYNPNIPSLGIEDYEQEKTSLSPINFPDSVYFDQRYAYQYNYTTKLFYDVSFYKMPNPRNPVVWSGTSTQQFNSTSYFQALWVTNNKAGFHFKVISAITQAATAQVTIVGHGLQVNDVIWINQVTGMSQINNRTATVLTIVDVDNITINIDSTAFGAYISGGIAQYLTNSISGQDGIRWYDGDTAPNGFVNFAPPLQSGLTPSYLVGCRILIQFDGRLFAIGTFERSNAGVVSYFANRVRYSRGGNPFYTTLIPDNVAVPIDSGAWYDNIPGAGGVFDFDVSEKILTAAFNQEVLIIGLEGSERKITATQNTVIPYTATNISPEFGSESTHAVVALDRGIISVGDYGYILTTSYNSQRFDMKIIDQIYQIRNEGNGNDQVCGIRNYKTELIFFTYPQAGITTSNFPNRTVVFNYRENNFAVYKEQYTTYGNFRQRDLQTWSSFPTLPWNNANFSWNSTILNARDPGIAGGNQQGFIQQRDYGTLNDNSHYISALSGVTITSPDHCLEKGDFIQVSGCIGSTNYNGVILNVEKVNDRNSFDVDVASVGTYIGGGVYKVLDNFFIQTKMFPLGWQHGRGCRVALQRYLFDTTSDGELTVGIYTSTNSSTAVNNPNVVNPDVAPFQIQSQIVRTRPDDSLGINAVATAGLQDQIWHRQYGSFVGDTVQFSLSLSDAQMRDIDVVGSSVVFHALIVDFYQGSKVLA